MRYVHKFVKPCFPPDFKVFDLFSQAYEEIIIERINSYFNNMDAIVEKEPQAVLAFNKFVNCSKEVMEDLHIEIISFYQIEYRLVSFYPNYMTFVERQIIDAFEQMTNGKGGFI